MMKLNYLDGLRFFQFHNSDISAAMYIPLNKDTIATTAYKFGSVIKIPVVVFLIKEKESPCFAAAL